MKAAQEVTNLHHKPKMAVIDELNALLALAVSGEIIGIGYTYVTRRQAVRAGLAGSLARDKWKAAGAFFTAAVEASRQEQQE